MQYTYDTQSDAALVRPDPSDFRLYFGIIPTSSEMQRHVGRIGIGHEAVRAAAVGDLRAWQRLVLDRMEWQAWAIRCERALANPEPGWDANGAPV